MKIPPKPEPQPSEWQVDERGRRYRMVGQTKEYEMDVNGIPQSVFLASNKLQREQREARIKEERRKAAEAERLRRNCPFRDSNGLKTDCHREACALFLNGCTLAQLTRRPPAKDTQGLICPFSQYRSKCRTDCALYKNGCAFTAIITESEE